MTRQGQIFTVEEGIEPEPAALEADALTTRPTRWLVTSSRLSTSELHDARRVYTEDIQNELGLETSIHSHCVITYDDFIHVGEKQSIAR